MSFSVSLAADRSSMPLFIRKYDKMTPDRSTVWCAIDKLLLSFVSISMMALLFGSKNRFVQVQSDPVDYVNQLFESEVSHVSTRSNRSAKLFIDRGPYFHSKVNSIGIKLNCDGSSSAEPSLCGEIAQSSLSHPFRRYRRAATKESCMIICDRFDKRSRYIKTWSKKFKYLPVLYISAHEIGIIWQNLFWNYYDYSHNLEKTDFLTVKSETEFIVYTKKFSCWVLV